MARGVLHGCIGPCCGKDYPSVFANLANEEIRSFIFDNVIGIKTIPIDNSGYSKITEMDTWKIFLIWYFIATLALSIAYLFYKWIKRLRYTPLFIIRKYLNQFKVNLPIIIHYITQIIACRKRQTSNDLNGCEIQNLDNGNQPLLNSIQLDEISTLSTNDPQTSLERGALEEQEMLQHYIKKGMMSPFPRVETLNEIPRIGQLV